MKLLAGLCLPESGTRIVQQANITYDPLPIKTAMTVPYGREHLAVVSSYRNGASRALSQSLFNDLTDMPSGDFAIS